MTVAAATVIGAITFPLVPAASAAVSSPTATVQHAGTARSATPRSASVKGPGGIGVRLLDVPANAVSNPRARHYIVDNLTPGTTIHRRIVVSNTTKSELHVAVYPDAATISQGAFVGAPAHTVNELSSWTTVSRPTLNLPAGTSAVDTVTVAIPSAASPGERYAVVWAEVRGAGGGIQLVNRAGIRMYLSVGGTNPVTSFTVNTMTGQRNSGGHPVVRAVVHNTGGRAVDLAGTLTLSSVTGALAAGPYKAQLGTTLAPGQSEPVTFVLTSQLADGPWNATVTLHSGLNQQVSRAQITFVKGPAAPSPAARSGGGLGLVPIVAGAILIAMFATLAALIITHRRRKFHKNRTGAQGF